ncbi:histidine kinase [Sphaerisporangium fuscum]|uniref:histidine kinase n=1 Tax=Sphaerisporangium fuscum TaxID=2835868 RepID=UPI001BDD3405|nr:histidine kinase [Sphaerisporangium fuscum]
MNGSATVAERPRPLRDRLVDTVLILFAAGFGLVLARMRLDTMTVPRWLFDLDQVIGALGCAALWWRRRRPVELAVTMVALSAFFELVAGPMLVALFTVAVHRPPRTSATVFLLSLVTAVVYVLARPEPDLPGSVVALLAFSLQGAVVGWGLFIRHRRQLVLSLRDRAARAETEALLRAEQAQLLAREALARDMHDVLGHRLSLLSVHAGALEFNPGATAEDIARAAKVIRESAHLALQDLREVVGVLRAPVGEMPQPTLAGLGRLAEESERAGMRVDLRVEVAGDLPESAGRTAYRVVQEALTNARKHAPGAEVRARVSGAAGEGLTAEVRNGPGPRAVTSAPGGPPPGAGRGLAGLEERVSLVGGALEYGPTEEGGWQVSAHLPWPR